MFKGIVNKLFGTKHDRVMKKLQPLVQAIEGYEPELKKLSDEQLAAKTTEFRERLDKGETLDDLLPEAFAVVREASVRVTGMRHYNVQVIGGIIMHQGKIAEMRTGEGKTLTATLPLYLNALAGKGAHLVTVNDYLAARDAEWMGEIYGFLGMTTGTIIPNLTDQQRQDAYACDITYGTNNEFGFDYLRDNMKYQLERRVQRPLNFAIVDEVDSVLIDEARTPLIISGKAEKATDIYYKVNDVVVSLKRDEDYIVDEEHRSVSLTEEGITKVEEALHVENLFEPVNIELLHHVNKALEAHTLYKRGEKYLVEENKVIIVDEFTGRKMDGRRWSDGLHQAVEAKEGVQIQNESVTLATVTYQNFFRMYDKLAGMTGTADTEAEEFGSIYSLDVVVIPTNRPIQRIDHPDVVYRTEREKFTAIVDELMERYEKGQPSLVGTVSVEKSEVISKVLKKKKIPHSVLNAKNHEREADIVAQAGRKGSITIATNMAGRGTDIVLGGNPEALAAKVNPDTDSAEFKRALERFKEVCAKEKQEVLEAGGLFILGTERHDSRRIDNQLRGRSGRQGDPGASKFFLSLEDELMVRMGADRIQGLMQRLGMEEGVPIEHNMVTKSIEGAQKRMEGRHFDVRKSLLEYDDVMDQQRKAVYELRTQILKGEGIGELVLDVLDSTLEMLLNTYANPEVRVDDWSMESLARELKENFKIEIAPEDLPLDRHSLEEMLWTKVREALDAKVSELDHIAEKYNEKFAEDADFEAKTAQGVFNDLARNTYLRELDKRYRDHLQAMRSLRASVRLHGYAQRDPKQIYKTEGYDLFQGMRADIATNVSKYIMRFVVKKEESVQAAQMPRGTAAPRRVTMSGGQAAAAAPKAEERRELPKIGRNDPCWCGSGKKYKKCHMRADQAAAGGDSASEPASAPAAEAPAAAPAAKAPATAPVAGGNGKVEIPADIAAAVADAKADKPDKKDQGISLI